MAYLHEPFVDLSGTFTDHGMSESMLTKQSREDSETAVLVDADQAVAMGETVAAAFFKEGGKLSGMSQNALARDLAEVLEPLLCICTNEEWIETINARLDRLESDADEPGPRLERFGTNGAAEMTTPAR